MVWSDTSHFLHLAEFGSLASQKEMVGLYDDPFLSGFSLPHSSEFDFWLTEEGGRLEQHYMKALKNLIQIKFDAQDYPASIQYAQQYLTIDELAEDVHQQKLPLKNKDHSQPLIATFQTA